MKYKILMILCLLYPSIFMYASDLEFDESAISNREEVRETNEYEVKDSLVEDYGVEDIFTEEKSSMDGKYTTEGLFEGETQEVSLVSGEFDDIFVEDTSYHDIYVKESKSSLLYKIVIVLFLVGISYILTQIYLIIKFRRKNAKNKARK